MEIITHKDGSITLGLDLLNDRQVLSIYNRFYSFILLRKCGHSNEWQVILRNGNTYFFAITPTGNIIITSKLEND